jgi:hypothetical protein
MACSVLKEGCDGRNKQIFYASFFYTVLNYINNFFLFK